MEEGAETAEELGVDHLAGSLPAEVGVVQRVVLVQPEDCNDDKKCEGTCNQNINKIFLTCAKIVLGVLGQ